MHPLEKKTLKVIRQEHLLLPGEKVVIGVSGGPDSLALLNILAHLAPGLDITLAAVYVNHGLRPDEADEEKSLVEAEANHLKADFFSASVDVKGLAARRKLSIEHCARLLRYEFLEKTAKEYGAKKIAMAHTADDQAEELLLRLIRGTAKKGLSGMKTFRDGRIIRPFLNIPKSHLLAYLENNSIKFVIDSSNRQNVYLRNRIRNELLPYLRDRFNPNIRQTLLRTANILQDEEELLEMITEAVFKEIVFFIPENHVVVPTRNSSTEWSDSLELLLNCELFEEQPRAIQRRLLEKCCWYMGCEPRSRQIEHLLHLAIQGSPNNELHLADGLRVQRKKNQLHFLYPQGRGPFRGELGIEGEAALPETRIHAPGIFEFPELKKRLVVECITERVPASGENFPTGEYLDSSLFSFPLTLRGPRTGDRFHPLGAPGSKKVFDFLSDQKIDPHTRRHVPVLCSDDFILALPGLRIDQRYKITDQTSEVIRVCWEEMEREVKE